jgi:hypothetical protein
MAYRAGKNIQTTTPCPCPDVAKAYAKTEGPRPLVPSEEKMCIGIGVLISTTRGPLPFLRPHRSSITTN